MEFNSERVIEGFYVKLSEMIIGALAEGKQQVEQMGLSASDNNRLVYTITAEAFETDTEMLHPEVGITVKNIDDDESVATVAMPDPLVEMYQALDDTRTAFVIVAAKAAQLWGERNHAPYIFGIDKDPNGNGTNLFFITEHVSFLITEGCNDFLQKLRNLASELGLDLDQL